MQGTPTTQSAPSSRCPPTILLAPDVNARVDLDPTRNLLQRALDALDFGGANIAVAWQLSEERVT